MKVLDRKLCLLKTKNVQEKTNQDSVLGWEGKEFWSLCQQDQGICQINRLCRVLHPILMEIYLHWLELTMFDVTLPDNKASAEL